MAHEVTIRPVGPGDAAAVGVVVEESFGDQAASILDVLALLRSAADLRVELVAEDEEGILGHVALSRAWLDARERLVDVLVLSPIGVRPARQGSGTGTALLAAAVQAAAAAGAPLVFLEGAPGFYAERGWGVASDHGLERPSLRIPDPACRVVLLAGHEPWMTGRLVYPDVWWRYDLVGLRDPDLAEVESALGTD
ncbi:putative acetyltransferase [Nocardioides alpinus]|uniref:GNAT family N-acetyltransferase n=1 Tax=Nocardioides alpinus TaxID=748909 RepID=A0A1I1B4P9_9ACTN|nr:GNAT family N-acetyltransferase [Nocardioides alpinus]PKH41430.1 GNAT family N-acetyltransferase [Nocardioides alpinus]SFB43580.1 putative acetyltransferase [Nocardioides alpinus]